MTVLSKNEVKITNEIDVVLFRNRLKERAVKIRWARLTKPNWLPLPASDRVICSAMEAGER